MVISIELLVDAPELLVIVGFEVVTPALSDSVIVIVRSVPVAVTVFVRVVPLITVVVSEICDDGKELYESPNELEATLDELIELIFELAVVDNGPLADESNDDLSSAVEEDCDGSV